MPTITTKKTVFGTRSVEVPRYRCVADKDGTFSMYDMLFPDHPSRAQVFGNEEEALRAIHGQNKAELFRMGKNPEFNVACGACGEESAFDETFCRECGAETPVTAAMRHIRMEAPAERPPERGRMGRRVRQ